MQRKSSWLESLSVALVYVLLLAPMVVIHQAMAVPVPDGPGGPSRPTYENSPHGQTIDSLWGIDDPAMLELFDLDASGSGDVRVQSDAQISGGSWTAVDDLFVGSDLVPIELGTNPPLLGTLLREASLVAGELSSPGNDPIAVVGMLVSATLEYDESEIEPATLYTLQIVSQHASAAAAEEFVDGMRDAEPYDPNAPELQCVSLWVGNDGFECCVLEKSLAAKKRACRYELLADLLVCVGIGTGAGIACLGVCLQAAPAAFTACGIICGIVLAAGIVGCFFAAMFDYTACLANADAWYIEALVENGCWPPPSQEI